MWLGIIRLTLYANVHRRGLSAFQVDYDDTVRRFFPLTATVVICSILVTLAIGSDPC